MILVVGDGGDMLPVVVVLAVACFTPRFFLWVWVCVAAQMQEYEQMRTNNALGHKCPALRAAAVAIPTGRVHPTFQGGSNASHIVGDAANSPHTTPTPPPTRKAVGDPEWQCHHRWQQTPLQPSTTASNPQQPSAWPSTTLKTGGTKQPWQKDCGRLVREV